MDIRNFTYEEKCSHLRTMADQFQSCFMEATGKLLQVEAFYKEKVYPLFEQKECDKDLKQINDKFEQIKKSFRETKGIGSDIVEGYCHVLMLYRFLVSFKYLFRVDHNFSLSSLIQVPAQSPELPEFKLSLSNEFVKIQQITAERISSAYQLELQRWSDTPFLFPKVKLENRAQRLKKEINDFNNDLKSLCSSPIPVSDKEKKDEIPVLIRAEYQFQDMILRYAELESKCGLFSKQLDGALLLLKMEEDFHLERLKNARIHIKFSESEVNDFQKIEEFKRVLSISNDNEQKYELKKNGLEALQLKIGLLQSEFNPLKKLFSPNDLLGGRLRIRNKIFALLREFESELRTALFDKYQEMLKKSQGQINELIQALSEHQKSKMQALIKVLKRGIRKKINVSIKPMIEEAISARSQNCKKYMADLKLQLTVNDEISSLDTAQEQLNMRWNTEVEKVIKEYRDELANIEEEAASDNARPIFVENLTNKDSENKLEKDKKNIVSPEAVSAKLKKIQTNIQRLGHLYVAVELRFQPIRMVVEDLESARKDKVKEFIGSFGLLLQEIEKAKNQLQVTLIDKQIDLYKSRYRFLGKLDFDKKKMLLAEVKRFKELEQSQFNGGQEQRLQKFITKVKLRLTQHHQRTERNKTKAIEEYKKIRGNIIKNPDRGIEIIREAVKEVTLWEDKEDSEARKELQSQSDLDQKVACITEPIERLAANLNKYPKPEYSCFWAFVWSLLVPLFGYCLYQWWYERQCRLAIVQHASANDEVGDLADAVTAVSSTLNSPGMSAIPSAMISPVVSARDLSRPSRLSTDTGRITRAMREAAVSPLLLPIPSGSQMIQTGHTVSSSDEEGDQKMDFSDISRDKSEAVRRTLLSSSCDRARGKYGVYCDEPTFSDESDVKEEKDQVGDLPSPQACGGKGEAFQASGDKVGQRIVRSMSHAPQANGGKKNQDLKEEQSGTGIFPLTRSKTDLSPSSRELSQIRQHLLDQLPGSNMSLLKIKEQEKRKTHSAYSP